MRLKNSLIYAFRRSIPVMVGYFPVGIAYGILMANLGYSFIWSAFSSLIVYAGSLQMLMVSFLMNNVPIITIVITSLLLNSRHIFYGISFVDKFKKYGFWKVFLIYGMSDENYSLLCSYKEQDGVNEKWVHIFSAGLIWLYWVLFSSLGGLIGGLITFNTAGIDFALTALFVVILIEQIKGAASKLPVIIGILSSVLWIAVVGPDQFLLPSLLSAVAVLIGCKGKISKPKEDV
jgi:4-azaleucine resistance transporter AzlC